MKMHNGYCLSVGVVIGMTSLNALAAESWNVANNSVTYSVLQDGIPLGSSSSKTVALNQLSLSEVATREGVGTDANYTLTSVVLSIHGSVYGTVYFKNKSPDAVTPSFMVLGTSKLTYGTDSTPNESYYSEVPIGTIAGSGGTYNNNSVLVEGSGVQAKTISSDLARFLGTGTIATIATFPVNGFFSSAGTDYDATVALQGMADIAPIIMTIIQFQNPLQSR